MTSKQHNQTYTPSPLPIGSLTHSVFVSPAIDILNQLPVSVRYKIATEIKRITEDMIYDDSVFDQSDQPVDEAANQNKNITDN